MRNYSIGRLRTVTMTMLMRDEKLTVRCEYEQIKVYTSGDHMNSH